MKNKQFALINEYGEIQNVKIIDDKEKGAMNNYFQYNNSKEQYERDKKLMIENPFAMVVLRYMINHADRKTGSIMCSYKVLEEEFNKSRNTVYKAIKTLKEERYIKIFKVGNMNLYGLNPNIVWTSYKEQMLL